MGFAIIGASKNEKEQAYMEITITEGDTLWDLAQYHAENKPKNQWIKEVMRLNDLSTGTIRQGEDLLLPSVRTVGEDKNITKLAGDNR